MKWFHACLNAADSFFDVDQTKTDAEYAECRLQAIDAFHELFEQLLKELKLRDEWKELHCHIMPFSVGAIEKSNKTGSEFTLGISRYGWFIESSIMYAEHIRYMTDEYWGHIVKLSSIGEAEFSDYGRPRGWGDSAKIRKLINHKGSLVFSIVRDFTLLFPNAEDCFSVGGISVYLPLDANEADVRGFFFQGLNALYRSNYLLYRSAYLEQKRFEKKHIKKTSD